MEHTATHCITPVTQWTQSYLHRAHNEPTTKNYNTAHHTATHLRRDGRNRIILARIVYLLQHTATCCNMLQHTATHLWRNGRNRVSLACTVHALLYFDSNALDHMSKPMHVGSTAFYFVSAGKNVRNSEWDSPAHVQQMQCVFVQWECKMEKEIKWKISCEVRVVETSLMR